MNKRFVFLFIALLPACFASQSLRAQKAVSLQQAREYYLAHAYTLKNAAAEAAKRRNDKTAALGMLLPGVSAGINHNYSFGSTINPATNSRQPANIQYDNFNAGAAVNIFQLENILGIRYAQLNVQQADYNLRADKLAGLAQLYTLFFQYQYDKEWTAILSAQVNDIDKQVQRTESEVAAGTRPKSDVYDIKANLSTLSEQYISAQNAEALSKNALAAYLTLPGAGNTAFELTEAEQAAAADSLNSAGLMKEILAVNPRLQALKAGLLAQEQRTKMAAARYMPVVSASYQLSSFYNKNLKETEAAAALNTQLKNNLNHYVSIGLALPVFNKLQTRSAVANEKLQLQQDEHNLLQAETELRQQLAGYLVQVNNARRRYVLLNESIAYQRLSFNKAEQKYKEGMIDAYTFFISRNNWLTAQYNLYKSKYEYLMQRYLLQLYRQPV